MFLIYLTSLFSFAVSLFISCNGDNGDFTTNYFPGPKNYFIIHILIRLSWLPSTQRGYGVQNDNER